ncbi:transcriptional regulator, TetR family [Roseobacter sp. GAI101]|nr:transcriptional regulator, TetR family [Roseobacter sp. GAI101]
MVLDMNANLSRQRGSRDIWLNAAYDLLISDGIEAVKIMALAKRLNLTRTGFYWFFKDIAELHGAMIEMWEAKNTATLEARCQKDASNICEALFHLMDCWLDTALFDAPLDLAIRNWARNDADLQRRVGAADRRRIGAVSGMFTRHGYSPEQAEVRGLTVIYTQIGYISMQVKETVTERHARVQHYVELFAGVQPDAHDVDRFLARQRHLTQPFGEASSAVE